MPPLCRWLFAAVTAVFLLPLLAGAAPRQKRLLVVTVTKGFRHADSIPVLEETIKTLGEKSGKFTVDFVRTDDEMAAKMTPEALKDYDGVFFGNTTGDLPIPDRDAFLKWIADGHGFCGAHAASDTFHGYKPFLEMIGGEFKTHGPQVEVECFVRDRKHPATKGFGASFTVFDEIYQFQSYDPTQVHLLLDLDRHPNTKEPPKAGEHYPIAWCRPYHKGRVFYTALGHRPDVWQNPAYQEHVLGGILWALGLAKGDARLPRAAK